MKGAARWVDCRKDVKRRDLERRILGSSLEVREALLVERRKLAEYGAEPDEIDEVLNIRYELFHRELSGLDLTIFAVHDLRTGEITILDVCRPAVAPDLYREACLALNLVDPAREPMPKH